ncbi:MAG TPA: hypothetical protein VHX16_05220, partial [Chloroflexota bacterium]|nr:hypothetical protein [Chloroflexota bacterium]
MPRLPRGLGAASGSECTVDPCRAPSYGCIMGYLNAREAPMAGSGRKVADCRQFPSEQNCTLTISGT